GLIRRDRRAERDVERMADIEVESIATVTEARVIKPFGHLAADAAVQSVIANSRLDQRKKSERINLRPIRRVESSSEIAAVRSMPKIVIAERIDNLFCVVS